MLRVDIVEGNISANCDMGIKKYEISNGHSAAYCDTANQRSTTVRDDVAVLSY